MILGKHFVVWRIVSRVRGILYLVLYRIWKSWLILLELFSFSLYPFTRLEFRIK